MYQRMTVGMLWVAWMATCVQADSGRCSVPFDDDGDCRVAINDFAKFAACLAGPGNGSHPLCACQDGDVDADVDMHDFASLQLAFTGDALVPGCDLTPGLLEPAPQTAPLAARSVGPIKWMAPELRAASPPSSSQLHVSEKASGTTYPHLFSGELHLQAIDMQIRGRGIDFVWGRSYRSRNGSDTPQGVGWDHSYNVWIESSGNDLVLHDGNGRSDTYGAVTDATGTTWCAPGFFRSFAQDPNGSYVCTFAEGGIWRFHPLDGTGRAGRLLTLADTNGNSLQLNYNNTGRLLNIVDTLGRTITLGYDSNGRVLSVTDFTGRQVTYSYYTSLDSGGDEGDLRTVTSPPVTGTPTGNDFPTGKTTTYTYSKGFGDPALNHNLLSVTDPLGQTFLVNTYAATLNPNDLDYDRVVQQQYGNVNDRLDYVYAAIQPTPANGYAVTQAIVNDRNGHVCEYLYDKDNRCVELRELTGQANPNLPTGLASNRPTGALRPTDPPAYVSTWRYNGDSLPVTHVDATGSVVRRTYASSSDPLSPPRERANLLSRVHEAGPRGGDQQQLVVTFAYDNLLNGDTNRVTEETDARGHSSTHTYDAAGNRTQTTHRLSSIVEDFAYNAFGQLVSHTHPDNGTGHRRLDTYQYYLNGPMRGYLFQYTEDDGGESLTTSYEYDSVGNPTRVVDPMGNDSLQIYNQLDQVVRTLSREPGPNLPRYEVDTHYDANENVVRVDVLNLDENGVVQPNQHFTTINTYDTLDHPLSNAREVDPNVSIVTQYFYDGERNRTLLRSGEATAGNQPNNTITQRYDERDLLYQVVRGQGDPDQSTTQYDYDGNGNVVTTSSGLEDTTPRVRTVTYDGFDRVVTRVDPLGNEHTMHYDENGNQVVSRIDGELQDVPGSGSNVRLSETFAQFDEMDRLFSSQQSFFDCDTQAPVGNPTNAIYIFGGTSQLLSATDTNGNTTTYGYDTALRNLWVADSQNNRTTYAYDDNSNVVSETEEARSDLGLPDEVFVTTHVYDALDRRIASTDSSGNVHAYGYDARNNLTLRVDGLSNETRFVYDGLNRLIEEVVDLDGDGADGDGPDIRTQQRHDLNSRCVERTDANGNATTYVYDVLDRCVGQTYADGSSDSSSYDVHGNRVLHVDANGSSISSTYDACDRVTQRSITPGPGVSSDTTFETFVYDGMHRIVSAQDDDSVLTYSWDSLSHPLRETLNGDTTLATYDGVGNRLQLTYPSGRQIAYTYDPLDRISSVLDGNTPIATYDYVGDDRITRQVYANGVETNYVYDGVQGRPNPPLDQGVKRIVSMTAGAATGVVDQRTFAWDAMHNKREQRDVRTGGPGSRWAYDYDAAYRLTEELLEDNFGLPLRLVNFGLDAAGNRQQLSGFGAQVGPYQLDASSPPSDAQMNQYTSTPRDNRTYDENGNLTQIVSGPQTIVHEYDYANRLVYWENLLTREFATYQYDVAGRRTRRAGSWGECRYRYAMSSDVIEDLDPNGNSAARYVYGAHKGGIVCVDVQNGGLIYYQQRDDLGSVIALTDPNGTVIERYDYNDFGLSRITDAVGTPLASSLVGNVYRFMGMRVDSETGWYVDGNRYLDPVNGRYVSRSKCMWNSSSRGNATQFLGGNPVSRGVSDDHSGKSTGRRQHGPPVPGGDVCPGGDRVWATPGYVSVDYNGCPTERPYRTVDQPCPHVTILKAPVQVSASPPHNGHVTILKAADTSPHNGHVTILKAAQPNPHHGHVTILKGAETNPHHGHVTILKAAETNPHHGHVTILKAAETNPHHGHVTILKAAGPASPPVQQMGAASVDDTGCGPPGLLSRPVRCAPVVDTGSTTVRFPVYHLISNGGGGGGGGDPGALRHLHLENVVHRDIAARNMLGSSATISPSLGGGGTRARHGPKCPCANCGPCLQHNYLPRWFCKGDHTNILPAANNISSR